MPDLILLTFASSAVAATKRPNLVERAKETRETLRRVASDSELVKIATSQIGKLKTSVSSKVRYSLVEYSMEATCGTLSIIHVIQASRWVFCDLPLARA